MTRVRFAPSPTGDLHVGGGRTALFNWLFARKTGGTFILRIEDTDGARNTEDAKRGIEKGLRWLGLDWDEGPDAGGDCGPYFQSQRKDIYDTYLAKLEAADRVYTEDNGAVRFKFSRTAITVHDLVCGDVTFAPTEEPDMTVRRPDGSYIFHFVNVVDDIEMKMTHVFRGEDHLSNTWKHIDLFNAFGATPPIYAHIPLILNSDGSKMSKRDAGSAIEHSYINEGFLPDAVFNYLVMLGWTPRADKEVLGRDELVKLFDPAEIHSSNARFDLQKCQWFNAQYLRALSPEALFAAARPFIEAKGYVIADEATATAAVYSVKEKVSLLTEIPAWVHYFFREDYPFEADVTEKLKAKPENASLLRAAAAAFTTATEWTEASVQTAIEEAAKGAGVKPGALMPLLRGALSGQLRGPGVNTIGHLVGKDSTLRRIERALGLF
ncbi:glutamate--tRNA ligase [Brevifollis gellanilyticus]|uniref:Glutamate--tRNA ligase n=1 Tax=Brevifollis gellanilyticus TaxID=748831 RepID=A0A512ME46_9BACT|nr:glutamate--tRNA ligase family protein [Brevifollis gellanilyticus]GEP45015.1 glutamate--tRNA ligase 2 [Brevifollis gellanilyticus]